MSSEQITMATAKPSPCTTEHLCLFGTLLILFLASVHCNDIDRCPSNLDRDRFLKTFGEKCYYFDYDEKFWDDAVSTCRRRGGNLVTIRTQAIQTFLQKTLADFPWRRNGVWIGATDKHDEMDWRWVTGQRVNSGYRKWDSGQPSCFLFDFMCVEDCACMRIDDGYRWHDYPCDRPGFTYSFICEYDMLPMPPPTTPTPTTPSTTTPTTPPTTSTKPTTQPPSTTETTTLSTAAVIIVKQNTLSKDYQHESEDLGMSSKTTLPPSVHDSPSNHGNLTMGNVGKVESQRLAADDEGLQTGGIVGMVVSFVLVFIAGLVIGVFLCRRRRKRYEEQASCAFNNVVYSAAPIRTGNQERVKNTNLMINNTEEDEFDVESGNHYTDIDDITCSGVVALEKKADPNAVTGSGQEAETEEGASGGSPPPTYPPPPPPYPGTMHARFAPDFLKKGTDVSQAYCNNLYDVAPSEAS